MRRNSVPMFEQLEGRSMFSAFVGPTTTPVGADVSGAPIEAPIKHAANAKSYNMMSVMGYTARGSSRNYNVAYWFDNNGATDSGNVAATVQVASKTKKLDGKNAIVVSIPGSPAQVGGAFASDSKGVYVLASDAVGPGGSTHLRLHGLQISPATMKVGQRFSDAGTFDGTFTVVINGKTYSGTLSGRAKSVMKITSQQTTVEPAGQFKTAEIQWDVTLTGTVTLNYEGVKINYDLNSTNHTRYRVAPGVGIVYSTTDLDNRYTSTNPFAPSVRTAFTTTFDLTGYDL